MTADPFHDVGADQVRHLRDACQAYPAMLEAIAGAEREIFLEMYWIGNDVVGARFRDALVARAKEGVAVRVVYDAVGSLGMLRSWWHSLRVAGGQVIVHAPVAPWRRRFRWCALAFRDHRKILVVDGSIGFVGGINLALPWLTHDQGGADWRDDAVEVRGPIAAELRALFADTWRARGGKELEHATSPKLSEIRRRVWMIANVIARRPDRRIRRAYLLAIRRARKSVTIASAYFLPGPLFLHALRDARKRGVRVRILVPRRSDVWLVGVATASILGRLLVEGVEIFAYGRSMMHSKCAVVDARFVTLGSHNLDNLSWRNNLECNIAVDDAAFASDVLASLDRDIALSEPLDLDHWRARPLLVRVLAWLVASIRFAL